MSRYVRVENRTWADEKVRALSRPQPNAQSLFLYLLTGPHAEGPGCFEAGEYGLAEKLRWPIEGFRAAMRELLDAEMVRVDWDAQVVWVVNTLKHDPPANGNVLKHWLELLETVPECKLKTEYLATLEPFIARFKVDADNGSVNGSPKGFAKGFAKGLPNGRANPEPEPIPEPEQLPKPLRERAVVTPRAGAPIREVVTPANFALTDERYAEVAECGTFDQVATATEQWRDKRMSRGFTSQDWVADWRAFVREYFERKVARTAPVRDGPVTFERAKNDGTDAAIEQVRAAIEGSNGHGSRTVPRRDEAPRRIVSG